MPSLIIRERKNVRFMPRRARLLRLNLVARQAVRRPLPLPRLPGLKRFAKDGLERHALLSLRIKALAPADFPLRVTTISSSRSAIPDTSSGNRVLTSEIGSVLAIARLLPPIELRYV